jgi:5-methylcytosine-specific restriction endonuclease McrBC GTP-binding regulatory subunit McrB
LELRVTTTQARVELVAEVCRRHGSDSIVLLSGVPATGKTHIALAAAQVVAGHPALVDQVQFHPSYSYEEFVEGFRPLPGGGFAPRPGIFLRWNRLALDDMANTYVLLVEELSRADVSAVLGELMTYIEYRDRSFTLPVSGAQMRVADNLVILATMNPRDRSALEIDDALIRRLRIVDCPPDVDQLKEMLEQSLPPGSNALVAAVQGIFSACQATYPETYIIDMPFGHGIFARVTSEADLVDLWHQRIRHLLYRPLLLPHPFAQTIQAHYPWR